MLNGIAHRIRAGFSGFVVRTFEEARAERELADVAGEVGYSLHFWSVSKGLVCPEAKSHNLLDDPVEVMDALAELPENSLLVMKDIHSFLDPDNQSPDPLLVRTMRDQLRRCRETGKALILLGCEAGLPVELQKEFTVIDLDLPGVGTLRDMAENLAGSANIAKEPAALDAAAEAARGLTTVEAEDVMALAIVETKSLDATVIAREKARAIARDGILEVIEPQVGSDDIGGLDNLKSWLSKRRRTFTREALDFGLPTPKGALILGIPGTGKSLTAKAASSILERPILKLDAGRLFAGLVGSSESNLRKAIATAEAIAPCILWIDELEKGFSGSRSSSSSDGGTSARVLGGFLSWMQEKESPVFVVATANDISQLPPEMLRKGRFDEMFFVDLPDDSEREAIWRIHIARRNRDPETLNLHGLVQMSEGFTGAEIEQVVIDALHECFDAGHDLTPETLIRAIDGTVPLSVTMAEQIKALRQWAKTRARPASTPPKSQPKGKRRIAA